MNVLAEFIQEQMKAQGWVDKATGKPAQIVLVRRSGLTKQGISQLLAAEELRRMIDPATVDGLARAFCWTKDEDPTPEQYAAAFEHWKRIILLKSAEAIGVPVAEPVVIEVPAKPSDEYVVERVREALHLLRQKEDGRHKTETSKPVAAPNLTDATKAAGSKQVSGETATSGDVRAPRRRSRGSDETNGVEQTEHSNRPQL